MPQFEFNLAMTSPIGWTFAQRTVEKGRLKALSIVPVVSSMYYAQTFVVVGTTIAPVMDQRPSAIFFAGYVSPSCQFIWTGDYPFSPYEIVFARGRSIVNVTVRIVGVTEIKDP